jgi:ribose transport system ATP-binding protein
MYPSYYGGCTVNCENLLSLRNITKIYSKVTVLDNVSLDIKKGEVHAIVGANGAGKSTLIKAISGAIVPDKGQLVYDGKEYNFMSPQLSSSLGIAVIYQEFNLIPSLSVAENIFMGNRIDNSKVVNFKKLEEKANEILSHFSIDIDASQTVKGLSVAYMQIVEIAKALSHNIKLLILDEPTAPLTNVEVDVLFNLINSLKEKGVSIIYISHRLEEIFEVCDRVTVLRDGKKIVTLNTDETNRNELIGHMINSEVGKEYPTRVAKWGKVLLEVKGLCGKGFKDISFKVHEGEIFGISGLVGAKRTEIVRAIFGADKLFSGEIIFEGKSIVIRSPFDAIRKGIAMIPEDRKTQGVILNLSIGWNLTLSIIKSISRLFVINSKKEKEVVDNYKNVLSIKMSSEDQSVSTLSGGNQQKLVLSKWLANKPKLIIFDEPTRGIDVGAKKEIYNIINSLADEGIGIILISSEMDEMIGLSDRMIVLSEGEITAELNKDKFNKIDILNYASGNK